MKAQIVHISEKYPSDGEPIEAKLIVKRDANLQTVTIRAWNVPSYERYRKILISAIRRMRR